MFRKNKLVRWGILLILLISCIIFISARGCPKNSGRGNRTGSSIEWIGIAAPSNLTATTISYSRIDLSWTDNSNNEDGFEIERSLDGINYVLIAAISYNINSYSDTTTYPNNFYYYRIRAFNTIGDRSKYTNVVSLTSGGIVAISAGYEHSLCLTSDGIVWSWGRNDAYQIGTGNITDGEILQPTRIQFDFYYSLQQFDNVMSVAGAYSHSLAIRTDKTLWAWGANGFGQLGDGSTDTLSAPVQIGNDSDWEKAEGGFSYSIGKKTNGTFWSWGNNDAGQLGLGDNGQRFTPVRIGSATDWEIFSAGNYSTVAIGTNGFPPTFRWLWAWGYGFSNFPSPINIDTDWNDLSAGDLHYLARKNNGSIWSWGWNNHGQLGLGDTDNRPTASPIGTDSDWSFIAAGLYHSFSIKNNGTLWSWGNNNDRQLGLGDTIKRLSPTQIGTDSDWSLIAGGNTHSIGLKQNGTILTWGSNMFGQLGCGDTINRPYKVLPIFGIPFTPLSLAASLYSPSQINLSWIDNSDNENGFVIERKTGRDGNYIQIGIVGANLTYYYDLQVLPLTAYYYRIRAFNYIGYSTYSNEAGMTSSGIWAVISAGYSHSHSIKTNGTLWSWGRNNYGQLGLNDTDNRNTPTQVGTDSDWSIISSKSNHSIASKTNSTLWSWGNNWDGQLGCGEGYDPMPLKIVPDTDWAEIASGNRFSIACKDNGTVWSWGRNTSGQLGLDDTDNRYSPMQVGTDTDWSKLAASNGIDGYALALKNNQTLWAWGVNASGQLGLGDLINRNAPTQVGTQSSWTMIATGYRHSVALKTNQTIWRWGLSYTSTPSQIGTDMDWSIITAGSAYTIASKINGTLWAYGTNDDGQLGLGDTIDRNTLTQIGSDTNWSLISSSGNHTMALKNNNTLWLWGSNTAYQLGIGTSAGRWTPTPINTDSDWSAISGGYDFSTAIKTDETIWGWGNNGSHQIISNEYLAIPIPFPMDIDEGWIAVTAGVNHTVARKSDGSIWAWGGWRDGQYSGQLGRDYGNVSKKMSPTQIGTDSDWSIFSAGGAHTIARKNDGTLWAWGYNNYGQLGLADLYNRYTPAQIGNNTNWIYAKLGNNHTIALKNNGSMWAWGYNTVWQLGLGDSNNRATPSIIGSETNWVSLGIGFNHNVALKNNPAGGRTLWGWGFNAGGQLGLGEYASITITIPTQIGTDLDWSIISAGGDYTLVLKTNKTIWALGGANVSGQLGLGYADTNILTSAIQIGTNADCSTLISGNNYNLMLKNNGTIWSWGNNQYGQLGLGDAINRNLPTLVGE